MKKRIPIEDTKPSIKIAPRRYENFIGKYKINLEEQALLSTFVEIHIIYVEFNPLTKNFDLLDTLGKRVTAISPNTFPNIPQDKRYELTDILEIT